MPAPRTSSGRRTRRSERGMAVFIVMLAITLLTGLGIWASRSASLVDIASGNNRQAIQAQYIADLGIQTTSAFLGDGRADSFMKLAEDSWRASTPETCSQNKDLTQAFCHWFDPAEVQVGLAAPMVAPAVSATAGQASLGPYMADPRSEVTGDFRVEMTDKGPAPPLPGFEVDGVNAIRAATVVLTSSGTVRPAIAAPPGQCDELAMSVQGQQMLRATTVVSPIFIH